MPAKRDVERDIDRSITSWHELKPGEKMAKIIVDTFGAECRCLVPGCEFYINVSTAPRHVMESELKDYYRDHRKYRHAEYVGRTLFEFELGPKWPRQP